MKQNEKIGTEEEQNAVESEEGQQDCKRNDKTTSIVSICLSATAIVINIMIWAFVLLFR